LAEDKGDEDEDNDEKGSDSNNNINSNNDDTWCLGVYVITAGIYKKDLKEKLLHFKIFSFFFRVS
jgi:hypothetical protein